jgi:ABC-type lipoprotein release transport system permease subunit
MESSIEKQRNIIDFTLSSLWRRKWKNVALVVVYTAIIFVLASVMFFADSLRRQAAFILRDAPEIIVQRTVAGSHDLIPVNYGGSLSAVKGVTAVQPRFWGYYFYPSVKASYTVMVPDGFGHKEGSIMIGSGIARAHGLHKGDTMWFTKSDGVAMGLSVVGILPVESEIISYDLVLMGEGDFRRLFGIPDGYATDLAVTVQNPGDISAIAARIVEVLPDTRPIVRDEILRTYEALFSWRQGITIAVLLGALLSLIILAWEKASGLSAEERREIGILKAVGWEISEVIIMKSWEGIVISLSAFLMGTIFAYLHIFFTSYIFFEPVLKGWSVLYPHFRLIPHIDPYQMTALFFLTVVPYTMATIIPSWKAAIVDPDEVMRL